MLDSGINANALTMSVRDSCFIYFKITLIFNEITSIFVIFSRV